MWFLQVFHWLAESHNVTDISLSRKGSERESSRNQVAVCFKFEGYYLEGYRSFRPWVPWIKMMPWCTKSKAKGFLQSDPRRLAETLAEEVGDPCQGGFEFGPVKQHVPHIPLSEGWKRWKLWKATSKDVRFKAHSEGIIEITSCLVTSLEMNRNELICGFCDLLFPLRSLMDVLFVMHSKAWMMMALSRLGWNWIESDPNLTMAVCVSSWLPVFRWTVPQRFESYIGLNTYFTWYSQVTPQELYDELVALDSKITIQDVAFIAGSWWSCPKMGACDESSILTWHILMTLPTFG